MQCFHVSELNSSISEESFGKNQAVKPIETRWEKFSACVVPKRTLGKLNDVKKFTVFEDDVLLAGYPRSGTTILAEMIWLMLNDFDFTKAKLQKTDDRVPGLE